jgi:hypothetical protein
MQVPGAATQPGTDVFAQTPPTGGEAAATAVPNMIGDLFGVRHLYTPVIATGGGFASPTQILRTSPIANLPITGGTSFSVDVFVNGVRIPAGTPVGALANALKANPRIPAGGASILPLLKIVENDSALPEDRVYLMYNYYDDVDRHLNPAPSQENVHREILGFEKTFLSGDASIGLRLPFYQIYGDDFGNRGQIGDLNIILKYALANNRETGNVFSGGLVVTAPSGSDFTPSGFNPIVIHDTLLQPFVSAIYCFSRDLYVQGFSSIVVPTDDRDVTLFDNDLAVGYFAFRSNCSDAMLTAVVPTVEVHATTPLNHRGALVEPIGASDLVDLTFGTSFVLGAKSTLTFGVAVPIVGPRPFDFEGQVQLNCRF